MASLNSIYNMEPYNTINLMSKQAQVELNNQAGSAQNSLSRYLGYATGDIQNAYNTALQQYAPQQQASYAALDQYLDLLGIPRYAQGAAAYQQANVDAQPYKDKISSLENQLNSGIPDQIKQLEEGIAFNKNAYKNSNSQHQKDDYILPEIKRLEAQLASVKNSIPGVQDQLNQAKSAYQTFMNNDPRFQMTDAQAQQQNVLNSLQNTPGYQFDLQQGLNTIQNKAAAGGMLRSGKTFEDLSKYSQNVANTYYQNAVNNAAGAAQSLGSFPTMSAQAALNSGQSLANANLSTGQAVAGIQNQLGSDKANLLLGQAGSLSSIYLANQAQNKAQSMGNAYGSAYAAGAGVR